MPVSTTLLLRSMMYMTMTLGWYDHVKACMYSGDVRESLRLALLFMMKNGIPLLVTTGRQKYNMVQKFKKGIDKAFANGSPMLLVDKDCQECSLIALVQPMGKVHLVDPGETGEVPPVMRNSTWDYSWSCLEMVVCITAVPAVSKWYKQTSFGGPRFNFNWGVEDSTANATAYVPLNAITNNMFNRPPIPLDKMCIVLGDYASKLAALEERPKEMKVARGRGRPKSGSEDAFAARLESSNSMWREWRRALLLEMVLTTGDVYGVAHSYLGEVLPPSMFGEPRECGAQACVLDESKRRWVDDLDIVRILQFTGPLEQQLEEQVQRPRPARQRKPRVSRKRAACSSSETDCTDCADCADCTESTESAIS